MPDYQNSKIYKLVGNDKVYIGSTTQPLCKRKTNHLTSYNCKRNECSSTEILSDPNHYIELIEYFPCNNKEELQKRERYYIENTECINKRIPTQTRHEHYIKNKDKIATDRKTYYELNRDKILQQKKQYRQKNIWKLIEKDEKYYELNRDRILQQKKEYYLTKPNI